MSGQAGFAVISDGATATAYSIDDPDAPEQILPQHMHLLFRGATDIVTVEVADAAAAIWLLRTEWSRDRLLQMLLLLLRSDGDPEARTMAAHAAEALFESNAARRFALNRLYSHPLTEDADVTGAINVAGAAGAHDTASRLRLLRDDQLAIAGVSAEWKTILRLMPELNRQGRLRRVLEESDVFYRLGRARGTSDLDALEASTVRSLPQRFADIVRHLAEVRRRAIRADRPPAHVQGYPSPSEKSYAAMLVANLPLVDKIATACARRYRLDREDAADLAASVKLALVENDYAILRKFEERSSLATYLTTVIRRLMIDRSRREWGRWYPSARAVHLGEDAVQFERLVWRDGYSVEQASRVVADSFRWMNDARLAKLQDLVPRSGRPVFVPLPEEIPDRRPLPYDLLAAGEVQRRLHAVIETLPRSDRDLITMRFWQDRTVHQIASELETSKVHVYLNLRRVLRLLRRNLEEAGLHPEMLKTGLVDGGDEASIRLVQSMYEPRE